MSMSAEEVLAEIGPVQEILDEHDGVVNVIDVMNFLSLYSLECSAD